MNPVERFNIDNYKEVLREVEGLGKMEHFLAFETRIIQEIVKLVDEGTTDAQARLGVLEKMVYEDPGFTPRNIVLVANFKNGIAGALYAAKICFM
jgi:hypothetical protein